MEQDGRGRTGKDDVCSKCGVMAERVAPSRRRNWHFKWENEVRQNWGGGGGLRHRGSHVEAQNG